MLTFKSWKIVLMSVFVMLQLSACSLTKPVKITPAFRYTLQQHNTHQLRKTNTRKTIMVNRTDAAPGYDTQAMLYVKQPYKLEAYAQNEWVAPPAQMISNLITRSLDKSNVYRAVMPRSFTGYTDYTVNSRLLHLEQDFTAKHNQIVMEVSVQVISNRSHRVLASKNFTAHIATTSADPYGGVMAANLATHKIMHQITAFVVSQTGK